jgi:huntingtin-interacting protein 1-related protein
LADGGGDLEHLRDEKDQEIQILQEGLDSALQQLNDQQQAGLLHSSVS